jgi:serine/threonine protein kinase
LEDVAQVARVAQAPVRREGTAGKGSFMSSSSLTTSALTKQVIKLGLMNPSQLQECQAAAASVSENPEDLLRVMERKGYLTSLQIDKLQKGDTTGFFLGGYRLLYKIASGSFGRVFRGDDPRSGQVVAIKVLRRRWSDDPANVDLFEREGRVGMTLRHPGIVEILNIGRDLLTKQYFIVMEFVEGGNLRDLLVIRKKFEPREALRLMEDVASGLAFAYSRGVTHRDIKPSNILISSQGMAKLVDFGLAQIYASRARSFRLSDEDEEMHIQRTVDYAGLERLTGVKSGDVRSDIFFLGCVLYEMLTGRAPLPMTKDRNARMNPRRFENIPPMRPDEVSAPPSLFHLVENMMALDVAKRFQTPNHLLDAIKRVRAELEGDGDALATALKKAPPTIFVVEQDDRLQDAIRDKLKKAGYRVLMARDPARALERFHTQPFEGLIIDIGTVGPDGAKTFTEIMERARLRDVACCGILILSEEQQDLRTEIPQSKAITVLLRPLKMSQLVGRVEEMVPVPTSS